MLQLTHSIGLLDSETMKSKKLFKCYHKASHAIICNDG